MGLHLAVNALLFHLGFGFYRAAEAKGGLIGTVADNLFQAIERAAANEQNIGGIHLDELLLGVLAAALRGNIGDGAFQDLKQCLLDALSADITGDGGIFALAGDLVDLINVDNAALGPGHIEIRSLQKAQQDVFHILANITGFGQGGGIRNGKGDAQHLG